MTGEARALRVEALAVPFGRHPGLKGIELEAAAGERLAIVGPSGSGKTTLLKAIAGLVRPAAGRVEIAGRAVTALPPERREAVYLHQEPVLFPHLSVAGNVGFPLRVRRVPRREIDLRVAGALEAVRLAPLAGRSPAALSGGERHRVALARAVVARPALLLLDEPLTGLDPALRAEVREALGAVHRSSRAALLLVTHDLDDAGLLADRIGVLLDGRLAQVAPPEELFARPASLAVARLLGIPNELPVEVRDGVATSALGLIPLPTPLPAGPAVAVFPPDALSPADDGVRLHVVAIRPRVRQTTAIGRREGIELELAVDPARPPAPGDEVAVRLDPARVRVFPAGTGQP